MNAIRSFIRNEPAILLSIVLAVVNSVFTLTGDQVDTVRLIVENVLVLVGGGVVRQNVTPTGN